MKRQPVKRSANRTSQVTPQQTVAEVLSKHVVLEVESIDRLYLNVIVGRLQIVEAALRFIRQQRKAQVFSTSEPPVPRDRIDNLRLPRLRSRSDRPAEAWGRGHASQPGADGTAKISSETPEVPKST
jgi:hypothetical protein